MCCQRLTRSSWRSDPLSLSVVEYSTGWDVSHSIFLNHFWSMYYPGQKKKIVTAEIFMRLIRSVIMWYHATSILICNTSSRRADTAGRVDVERKIDIARYHISNCWSTYEFLNCNDFFGQGSICTLEQNGRVYSADGEDRFWPTDRYDSGVIWRIIVHKCWHKGGHHDRTRIHHHIQNELLGPQNWRHLGATPYTARQQRLCLRRRWVLQTNPWTCHGQQS